MAKLWAGLSLTAALVGAPATLAQTPDVAAIYKDRAGRPFADLRAERAPVEDRVVFAFGSAALGAEALEIIEQQAHWLLRNPSVCVRVEGLTDARGSRASNLRLGLRRAEAVRNALVLAGAPRAQIEILSYGEDRPVDLGASPAALQRNRLARTVILPGRADAQDAAGAQCPR